MEAEVWRHGAVGGNTPKGTRAREFGAEEDCRGADPGYTDAARRKLKKVVNLAWQNDDAVQWISLSNLRIADSVASFPRILAWIEPPEAMNWIPMDANVQAGSNPDLVLAKMKKPVPMGPALFNFGSGGLICTYRIRVEYLVAAKADVPITRPGRPLWVSSGPSELYNLNGGFGADSGRLQQVLRCARVAQIAD